MTLNLNSEQLTEFAPESERKKRANLLVLHNVFQALWESEGGKRTSELSVLDGVQIFLGLTRHILFNCEHLILLGKVWNFKWRQEAISAPLGGLVTTILILRGVPLHPKEIATLLAPYRNQPIDLLEKTVTSFLLSRLGQLCFELNDGRFGLLDWTPQVEGLSLEEAIEWEFWQREEFANWLLSITPSSDDPRENAKALLDFAGMPLSHRELLFALWAKASGNMKILPTFTQLLETEGFQTLSLGYWVTEKGKATLTNLLLQQSEEWKQKTQQRARYIETRKLQKLTSSFTDLIKDLSPEVGDEIAEWLETQSAPVPLTRVAEQVLEVLPTDPDYERTLCSLYASMVKDDRFVNLGGQNWWLKGKIPKDVLEIPMVLIPPSPPPLPEDLTGQVDLVLPIEGIDDDLRRFVEAPSYEEVGETEIVTPSELKHSKRIDIALIYPHLQAGTLKIRRIDAHFFQPEPSLQFLQAIDDEQREFGLWVNLSLGLCFGLSDWYLKRKVGVGGIVRLEKTKGEALHLIWTNRYDRWLHIPRPRLEELKQFAAHETIRQAPLITLVQSLLTQHPKGIHFLTLWSELNVLRRTTKIALASILCSYPMFVRVQGQEGYWNLDFSKFTEGIHPEKRIYLERVKSE